MLKVGLAGAGAIARTFHLPAWTQIRDAHVVAICDTDPEAAREAAAEFQTRSYPTYD